MKGGRPWEALDTRKWNALLASLLFLSGREDDGVFNQFYITNVKRDEMGLFHDTYVRRMSNPAVVPQTQLQSFVQKFFGIGRITFLKHLNVMKTKGILEKTRLPLKGKLYGCIVKVERPSDYFVYTKEDKERKFEGFARAVMKTEFVESPEFYEMLAEIVDERPVEKKPLARRSSAEIFRAYPEVRKAFTGYLLNYYLKKAERNPYLLETRDEIGILSAPPGARDTLTNLLKNVNLKTIAEIRDDVVSENICPICLTEPKLHTTNRSAPHAEGYSMPGERVPVYLKGEAEKVCPNCGYTRKGRSYVPSVKVKGPEYSLSPGKMGNTRYPKRKGLGSYSKYEDQIRSDIAKLKKEMEEAGIEV